MSRVKRGVTSNKRRKNVLKAAKGYRFGRSTKEVEAKVALRHAGVHAFAHRKDYKNDMRRTWTVKMNAALRTIGDQNTEKSEITYSKFINMLKLKNIIIDRKIFATLAENDIETFNKVVAAVR